MTVIRLPDETLPAFPRKTLAAFYSTKPFSSGEFAREVGGLDAVILREVGTENTRPLEKGVDLEVNDVVLINPNHNPQLQAKEEDRPRRNYVIFEELPTGYRLRELPGTLIFPNDVQHYSGIKQ